MIENLQRVAVRPCARGKIVFLRVPPECQETGPWHKMWQLDDYLEDVKEPVSFRREEDRLLQGTRLFAERVGSLDVEVTNAWNAIGDL